MLRKKILSKKCREGYTGLKAFINTAAKITSLLAKIKCRQWCGSLAKDTGFNSRTDKWAEDVVDE